MNSNYIKSIAALTLLVILNITYGCFPKDNGIPNYTISDEFSSYCWFDTTSSWVYQNDSTLSLDSIVINEVTDKKRQTIVNGNFYYQAVEMYLNTNALNIFKYEITAGDYTPANGEMNSLLRTYYNDGSYQLVFSPEYPIGEEVILGDLIGNYTNVEKISSYSLLGKTYSNVYHSRIVISTNTNIEYNYWIAPNFGIIKSTVNNDGQITSISLKSSNLLQPAK